MKREARPRARARPQPSGVRPAVKKKTSPKRTTAGRRATAAGRRTTAAAGGARRTTPKRTTPKKTTTAGTKRPTAASRRPRSAARKAPPAPASGRKQGPNKTPKTPDKGPNKGPARSASNKGPARSASNNPTNNRPPPKKPSRGPAYDYKNAMPEGVNGGIPLYAFLNSSDVVNDNGKRFVTPKYRIFRNDGSVNVRNTRDFQELTRQEKLAFAKPPPPPVCAGENLDLRAGATDREGKTCFVRDMRQRLGPVLERISKDKAAGVDACASSARKSLQPHQQGVFEIARAMASRTPEQLGGSRGLLVYHSTGAGKSCSSHTPVILFSGRVITAGELEVGMELLGMDGTPRRVLSVGRGEDDMYEIRPTKGEPWQCNSSHILSLKYNRHAKFGLTPQGYTAFWHQYETDEHGKERGAFRCKTFKTEAKAGAFCSTLDKDHIVDIPLLEYLDLPKSVKHCLKQFRTGRVEFERRDAPSADPYTIGAWLGDGHSDGPQLTLGDPEIADEIRRRTGLVVKASPSTAGDRAPKYSVLDLPGVGVRRNPFTDQLRRYDLLGNKHIPDDFKCGSVETRLAVLAGLLDTDGYMGKNTYEIVQKVERLSRDIAFVARSLGFAAYVREVEKACVKPDGERVKGTYYKVSISGSGLEDLPMVVARKRAEPRRQIKDALVTGFEVVPIGRGRYVGPVLDGDHRYVLGDFTVTHNTVTALGIILAFWKTKRRIVMATTPANKDDNNLHKYAQNLFELFPEYVSMVFPNAGNLPSSCVKKWCASAKNIAPLTNRVKVYTFTTLASELGAQGKAFGRQSSRPMGKELFLKGGEGSVLIMDEVQSLFTPAPSYSDVTPWLVGGTIPSDPKNPGKGGGKTIPPSKAFLLDPELPPKMMVFALTATPGNRIPDMINVLNFVRPVGAPAFTPADASDPSKFAGLVSYVDIRSDTSRYGTKAVQNLYVPMNPRYYAGFLRTIKLEPKDLDYEAAAKASKEFGFLGKQRTAGDYLVKTAVSGLYSDKELAAMLAERVPRAVKIGGQVRVLSDKLVQLLENVAKMPGKQYVWVSDLTTAKVVAAGLERLGFKGVRPGTGSGSDFHMSSAGESSSQNSGGVDCSAYGGENSNGGKKPRRQEAQAVLTPNDSLKTPGHRYILYKKGTANGEELSETQLSAYANYYNDRGNDAGGWCKVMLATETFYQGLDMRALQGVHLVDALFNSTADKQAVGRALRLCGHSGAPSKRVVVHRYFSVPPAKFDVPEVKGAAAQKRLEAARPLDKMLRAMPAASEYEGVQLPEGTTAADLRRNPGINTYVHASAAKRQVPVTQFELGLKAFSVDCQLFKPAYHRGEPFECGVKPAPPREPVNRAAAKAASKAETAARVAAETEARARAKARADDPKHAFFRKLFGDSFPTNTGVPTSGKKPSGRNAPPAPEAGPKKKTSSTPATPRVSRNKPPAGSYFGRGVPTTKKPTSVPKKPSPSSYFGRKAGGAPTTTKKKKAGPAPPPKKPSPPPPPKKPATTPPPATRKPTPPRPANKKPSSAPTWAQASRGGWSSAYSYTAADKKRVAGEEAARVAAQRAADAAKRRRT